MNLDRFVVQREDTWDELEGLVTAAGRRPERLGPEHLRRIGRLYRQVAADLAIARRSFPSDPLVDRLTDLTGRARSIVYEVGPRREGVVRFFTNGYWRRVRERPVLLAVAAALLLAPGALAAVWGLVDPGAAGRFVPPAFRAVTEPRPPIAGQIPIDERTAFATGIFVNNIRVSLLAFAGGIAAGLGTALVVVFNGVLLGAVTGLAVGSGNGAVFLELVAPHGVLELSCIVVAAAAGLRLGWAIVAPGLRPRGEVLVEQGRHSVEILLGTLPWLVVAGLIEGLLTPTHVGVGPALGVGIGAAGTFWALVVVRGRADDSVPQSRARALARR